MNFDFPEACTVIACASSYDIYGSQNGNGNYALRITFTIMEGKYERETITRDFWLTQKAWPFTRRVLRTCGVKLDGLNEGAIIGQALKNELVGFGAKVRLVIGPERDQNSETIFRVKFVNPIATAIPTASPTDAKARAAAILARLRGEEVPTSATRDDARHAGGDSAKHEEDSAWRDLEKQHPEKNGAGDGGAPPAPPSSEFRS